MTRALILLLGLLGIFGTSGGAYAHTRSESSSTWTIDGRLVRAELSVPDLEAARITPNHVRPDDRTFLSYVGSHLGALASGKRCSAAAPPRILAAAAGYRRAELQFDCPSDQAIALRFAAFFELVPTHVDLAQIQLANGDFAEQLFTIDDQTLDVTAAAGGELQSAGILDFIRMGMEHIFTGIDHMSFLLGLVLISRRLRDLIFVVTGFTIGHSVTLGLAVTGLIRPHAEFIDALVALTIALIGMENIILGLKRPIPAAVGAGALFLVFAALRLMGIGLLPPLILMGAALFTTCYLLISAQLHDAGRLRLIVTLIFGLIHGFGFAGGLLEMRLPREKLAEILFGFNVGVEIGQLTVVLSLLALAEIARRLRLATPRPITVDVAASLLIGVGMFWFVGRSFA